MVVCDVWASDSQLCASRNLFSVITNEKSPNKHDEKRC
jgi:hypothetical protein